MISRKLDEDNNLEILLMDMLPTRWIDFKPEINLDQYEKVHVENGEHYKIQNRTGCVHESRSTCILPVTAAAQLE